MSTGPPSGPPTGPPSGSASGATPGSPSGPPAGPATPPRPAPLPPGGRSRRQDVIVAAIAVIAMAVAGVLVISNGPPAKKQVVLTASTATGNDPFTPPVAAGSVVSPTPTPSPSATPTPSASPSESPTPSPSPAATPIPSPTPGPGGTVTGSAPGLYGGTRNAVVCDKQKMIDYLRANPAKERAWGQAQGIAAADVPAFIGRLTSVLLRYDTRVTNHGFVNGYANPYEDVMQAGTAVLVDQFGVPRARCYCGNPLTPPVALQGTPSTTGTPWSSYQPGSVVTVQPAPQPQTTLTVVDTTTNTPFPMPVGGAPPKPPVPTVVPSPAATSSASPSPSASPTPTASPSPTGAVPAGDHYGLTFNGSKPFGQFIDDSGNTATVTQQSCDSVEASLGGGTDAVVSISGSSMKMTFQNGELDGTINPDGTYDVMTAPMPRDSGQAGVTVTFVYESKGTLANGSIINAAIRETINEQPNGGSAVSGGCDFLFNGAKS